MTEQHPNGDAVPTFEESHVQGIAGVLVLELELDETTALRVAGWVRQRDHERDRARDEAREHRTAPLPAMTRAELEALHDAIEASSAHWAGALRVLAGAATTRAVRDRALVLRSLHTAVAEALTGLDRRERSEPWT